APPGQGPREEDEAMNDVSRRQFLQMSSGAALGAGLMTSTRAMAQAEEPAPAVSPNERIVIGFVGVAGRGFGHISWFGRHPDVEIGAVCDVYDEHLNRAVEMAPSLSANQSKPKGHKDLRKLLEQRGLDAVVGA